ncbi:MAG TPA: hypothetical protein EYP08_03745 [Pyrodictiaceae archaeon]|nr:hypothetical protein [Pyrodictiaceae archaeon]
MSNIYYVLELRWTLQFTTTITIVATVLGAAIGRSFVATLSAMLAGYTVYTTILLLGLKPLSWIIFTSLASLMDKFTLLFAGTYTILSISNVYNTSLRLGVLVVGFYSFILATLLHGCAEPLPLLAFMFLIASYILYAYRRFTIPASLAGLIMLAIFYWNELLLLLVSTAIGFAIIASTSVKTVRKSAILLLSSIVLLVLYLALTFQRYNIYSSPLFWATILMLTWSLIEVVRRTITGNTGFDEPAAILPVTALLEVLTLTKPSNVVESIVAISPFTLATLMVLAQKHVSSKKTNSITIATAMVLALALSTPLTAIADSQPQSMLVKHCTKCHNGIAASTIEEMIASIRAWAFKYQSLDKAVEKLYGYKSFKDYIAYMVKLTNLPSDYIEPLTNYFEDIFSKAKKALEAPKTITVSVDSLTQKLALPMLILTLTTSSCIAFLYRRWSTSS